MYCTECASVCNTLCRTPCVLGTTVASMDRGDVYRVRPEKGKGSEQRGPRYGVIMQTDALPLSTRIIVPTSTVAQPADFRPTIEIDDVLTLVLTDQVRAVAIERFGDRVGRVTPDEMASIEQALLEVLAIEPLY